MIKNIYNLPPIMQWIISILLLKICLIFDYILITTISFPILFLIIPLLKVFNHFSFAPLLRLIGYLHYYSPLLLIIKRKKNIWEIHGGNMFDFFINMKWNNKGTQAQRLVISNYLKGLLEIINEIERSKKVNFELFGISYILNEKTAKKLGFSVEQVKLRRKFLFFLDYINLAIMYSFSKGEVSFPNILKTVKVSINSCDLLKSKNKITEYFNFINKRNNLITS